MLLHLQLVLSTTNAIEVLQIIQQQKIDLVFPGYSDAGNKWAAIYEKHIGKSKIIFTTVYSEYAMDGYEYNMVDYLLKPISFDRFYTAVQKANELYEGGNTGHTPAEAIHTKSTSNYIFVRTDSKRVKVQLQDVLFYRGT